MIDLKSQTLEEMTATLKEMGEPAFRGKQVFTWLHKGVTSFDEMSNLSKPLREKLRERCYITAPTVARKQVSKLDGTIKYLWELSDGNCICRKNCRKKGFKVYDYVHSNLPSVKAHLAQAERSTGRIRKADATLAAFNV